MILLYDRFYVEQQSPFLDHNGLTAMLWRCSVDVYDTINLRTSFSKGSYEFGLMRVEGDGYARLMCRKEQDSFHVSSAYKMRRQWLVPLRCKDRSILYSCHQTSRTPPAKQSRNTALSLGSSKLDSQTVLGAVASVRCQCLL